jgi:hypothetical protein
MTGTAEKIPCLVALRATTAFPTSVLGPVDSAALRRLASILASVVTVKSSCADCGRGFRIR